MGLKFEPLEEDDAAPMMSQSRGDPLTPAPSAVRPTTEVTRFLQTVRREFADKPEKFERFRAVLVDYGHKNIDKAGLIDRMQVVLNGHPDLVRRFNTFFPRGFALKNDQLGEGPSGDRNA